MIRTLKSREELDACRDRLKRRGLDYTNASRTRLWRLLFRLRFRTEAPLPDPAKSWDVAHGLELIEQVLPDRCAPILDMGCYNSEILYVLHGSGYSSLRGCDLNPICRWMAFWNQIEYRVSDLTRTPYPDRSFAALTCLSVVEHGVPLDALVTEVSRLIRPGGLFLFTTDYDATGQSHEIDPKFQVFGQSWRIFSPPELAQLIDKFRAAGFTLWDPAAVDDTHTACPISWNGQNYTFIMVALRAPA